MANAMSLTQPFTLEMAGSDQQGRDMVLKGRVRLVEMATGFGETSMTLAFVTGNDGINLTVEYPQIKGVGGLLYSKHFKVPRFP